MSRNTFDKLLKLVFKISELGSSASSGMGLMRRSIAFTVGLSAAFVSCVAWKRQDPDFEKLWEYEQGVRSKNNDSIRMTKNQKERRESLANLESLLEEMYTPKFADVRDRQGFFVFFHQTLDIRNDLIEGYCIDGDYIKALQTLKDLRSAIENPPPGPTSNIAGFYVSMIRNGENTAKWAARPEVKKEIDLLARLDNSRQLKTYPYSTEYKEKIPLDDRLAGVSYIWSEAKYLFANFDLVPELDWDKEYKDALKAATKTESTYEYYKVLRRLVGKLGDSHTDVSLPQKIREKLEVRPQIMTLLIENRVVVYEDAPTSLAESGLKRGDVILEIDGKDAVWYGKDRWSYLGNFSTPQDAQVRRFFYNLLRGPAGKDVSLKVQKIDGSVVNVKLPRDLKQKGTPLPDCSFKMLPNGVAYFAFNTCMNQVPVLTFRKNLETIKGSKGLIIDVRRNGGGNSDIGYQILSHLISSKVHANNWTTPRYAASYRAWGRSQEWFKGDPDWLEPHANRFMGKTVVLTGPMTFSAAEDFTSMVKMSKEIKIIGEATGGSTGQPQIFRLPGGGSARICTKRDRMADGTEFVGKGVQPDVVVSESVQSIREGRDLVLERALDEFK